jgi:hypothetical protein
MKKILFLVSFLGVTRAFAATNQPYAAGNEALNLQVFTANSQVSVATNVPVAITATNMVIESTGGLVEFAITSAYPAITTSTALSGQYLVLSATTSTSIIQIDTGTATAVMGDDQYIVISSTKSPVSFIYNSTLSKWLEIGKQ